jgi:hypothetical protein
MNQIQVIKVVISSLVNEVGEKIYPSISTKEHSPTDRCHRGSIAGSIDYKVLHRPIELAPFIRMWEGQLRVSLS